MRNPLLRTVLVACLALMACKPSTSGDAPASSSTVTGANRVDPDRLDKALASAMAQTAGTALPESTGGANDTPGDRDTTKPVAMSSNIRVIDPGTEPRRKLRYQFKSVKESDAVMDMKLGMEMKMGAQSAPPMTLPTIRSTMHIKPVKVSEAGDLTYDLLFNSIDVLADAQTPAPMREQIKSELGKVKGFKGSATVSARGETIAIRLEVPPDTSPQIEQLLEGMKQQVNQMCTPLPEEEVGRGAKWEKQATLSTGGINLTQKTTYTLTDVKGDLLTLNMAVLQSARAQQIQAPGLPPGAKVSLEAYETKGTGKNVLDLNAIVGDSTTKADTMISSKIEAEGQSQPMKMNSTVTMTFRPKK